MPELLWPLPGRRPLPCPEPFQKPLTDPFSEPCSELHRLYQQLRTERLIDLVQREQPHGSAIHLFGSD